MITGMWKHSKLYCGNCHEELQEMYIRSTDEDVFYACPKYNPENRTSDELPCMNRISVAEYEKMLNTIADNIMEEEENGNEVNLTHCKFKTNIASYEIIKHTTDTLYIKGLSNKAIIK